MIKYFLFVLFCRIMKSPAKWMDINSAQECCHAKKRRRKMFSFIKVCHSVRISEDFSNCAVECAWPIEGEMRNVSAACAFPRIFVLRTFRYLCCECCIFVSLLLGICQFWITCLTAKSVRV